MEYFRTVWCPFEADFSTSSYAQINRGSIFEVDGIKRRLSSTIGVKQGDLLGPELFVIFMAGVMETWRPGHDCEYCTLRTREDFIVTGRNPNPGGKNVYGKQYTEFAVSDSEYTDDTAIPFCNRADAVKYTRRYSWIIFDVGAWRFTQDPTTLSRVQRPNCYSVLALSQRTKTRARVTTRI